MVLDTEEQRQILLQLVNSATFPGSVADKVFYLKNALDAATIGVEEPAPKTGAEEMLESR